MNELANQGQMINDNDKSFYNMSEDNNGVSQSENSNKYARNFFDTIQDELVDLVSVNKKNNSDKVIIEERKLAMKERELEARIASDIRLGAIQEMQIRIQEQQLQMQQQQLSFQR